MSPSVSLMVSVISGGMIVTSPTQGSIIVELADDDPEYISVEEQVVKIITTGCNRVQQGATGCSLCNSLLEMLPES